MSSKSAHTPVFAHEIIALLKRSLCKRVIDATFGEGGHSILLCKSGFEILAIEYDKNLFMLGRQKIAQKDCGKVSLLFGNFSNIEALAKTNSFKADAVLFDYGVSMHQIQSKKGFSFKGSEPLDMRADTSQNLTAEVIINSWRKEDLYGIFTSYSEIVSSERLVNLIYQRRRLKRIKTTHDLAEIAQNLADEGKDTERLMRQILQALRIAVNSEFDNLIKGLEGADRILNRGGIVITITFHSVEDRMVKQFFKKNKHWIKKIYLDNKHINSKFAYGAKLRAFEKK